MELSQNPNLDAPSGELHPRVRGLERSLQDAYIWAYTSGKLSEIDGLMEEASVPIPAEMVTRSRMIKVWEEGVNKFPGGVVSMEHLTAARALSWMLRYASQLPDVPYMLRREARECLWKIASVASSLLPDGTDTLALALEEYIHATRKHPRMTLECDGHTDATRMFSLVEEIGEVAACLTYDNNSETGHNSNLESEVIQVVALALAWATRYLEEEREVTAIPTESLEELAEALRGVNEYSYIGPHRAEALERVLKNLPGYAPYRSER